MHDPEPDPASGGSERRARWRLFIAHPVPSVIQEQLHEQLAPYRRRHPHVRWTPPGSWHLTLLFLGSVDAAALPALRELVDRSADETQPYGVEVGAGSGRLRRGEGVAWLSLTTGAGRVVEVAQDILESVSPDITEGPPPKRPPSAHLTVARRADQAVIEALRSEACGRLAVRWQVDRIRLLRSHLEPHGAKYVTLHEATL